MRATEMHDLLSEAYKAIAVDVWRPGSWEDIKRISYCRYCSYSQTHGHGDTCILVRLQQATSSANEP